MLVAFSLFLLFKLEKSVSRASLFVLAHQRISASQRDVKRVSREGRACVLRVD